MKGMSAKEFLGFSLMDGIYWGFYAAFGGFATTYLLECGLSSSVLSIMLSIFMLLSFIGAFFWGSKCDKAKTNKKVFIPQFLMTVAVAMAIYFLAKINIWISTCLYPVFGFLSYSLGSNLDTWMLRSFHKDAGRYGKARSIGSMGYAVVALVMGQLIQKFGYSMIPVGAGILALIVFVFAVVMQELPMETAAEHLHMEDMSPKKLMHIPSYVFMLVVVFLTGLAMAPVNNLKIVILQSVGGDVSVLGIDSFLGVCVQAVLIFISGKLKRIPTYLRLFLMAFAVLLTQVSVAMAFTPALVILGTVFANISYGIMLPTQREIVESDVPSSLKNTAHSLSDAMFGSFSGILALTYSGVLMDAFGAKFVAVLGIGIMSIASVLALVKMLKVKKNS